MALASAASDPAVATVLTKTMSEKGEHKMSRVATDRKVMATVGARYKQRLKQLMRAIADAQVVSLCFVVDTTGSMSSHIKGVRDQVSTIVRQLQRSKVQVAGVAFIGYKDWSDGDNHFEVLPFTKDLERFQTFVQAINATGGGDCHEDVLGALEQAGNLSWPDRSASRILFHFGDAPPHGKRYGSHGDDYPDGHARDKAPEDLFANLAQQNISYYFGEIQARLTAEMKRVFAGCMGVTVDDLAFDAQDPATITTVVTAAAHRTVASMTDLASKVPGATGSSKHPTRPKPTFEKAPPDWEKLPWTDCTVATFDLPSDLLAIKKGKFHQSTRSAKVRIAPAPFDSGSVRLAYFGRMQGRARSATRPGSASSSRKSEEDASTTPSSALSAGSHTTWEDDFVFKRYIEAALVVEGDRYRCMQDMEVQTVAAFFSHRFNEQLADKPCPVKFLKVKVARFQRDGVFEYMALERRYVGGEFLKFTNNLSYVKKDASKEELLKLLVAFSHWTFHISNGYLLISDLQGIFHHNLAEDKKTLLLTDPAIHCTQPRWGLTNLGTDGMQHFFSSHECNEHCRTLALASPEEELRRLKKG